MKKLLYISGLVVTMIYSAQAQVMPGGTPQDGSVASDSAKVIRGRIIDAGNRPLPGVSVSSNDSTKTAVTDDAGAFVLPYEQEIDSLRLYKAGYDPRRVALLGRKQLTTFITGGPPVSPAATADTLSNLGGGDVAGSGQQAETSQDTMRTQSPQTP
jgi:hypothetical protein